MFGWLVLIILSIITSIFLVRNIYFFLAPNDPVGARILVVEGWLPPKELDQAVQTFKRGGYERIVTTGGPIVGWPELLKDNNYASMAGNYLAQRGVPRDAILVVPSPASAQERTFLSAVVLRKSERQLGITLEAIDLFSSGAHARRSRLLFQMAFGPKIRVGILSSKPEEFDPNEWWRTSAGAESIFFQLIGFIWVKCFFWPGPPGSPQEFWAEL